ncbi:MAG: lipopolysaccharide heptosyltransferase II [Deltaproteobacteria bacterium]|nr:lipopolysaccharide heptosyltransferase II [Deltaproteobacteria bacterium]
MSDLRIVVRTPNWLGDLVMSLPFLRAVLQRFPQAGVDLIVRQGFETLPLPHRGKVIPYDRKALGPGRYGWGLRGAGYTHFFVLPPSLSSAWMAFTSRVPQRIGHPGDGRRWLLSPAIPYTRPPRSRPLAEEYLELLAPWGTPALADYPARFPLPEGWAVHVLEQEGLTGLLPERFVALAPGAEFGPAKQWPVAHYRALAGLLASRGWPVVVVGLPKEREAGEEITRGVQGKPAGLNLCGRTRLAGMAAVLARASGVVSNDSGAMHVAAALGRPQVALFGSTNPGWTAPLNPQAKLIHLNLPCSPCYQRVCPLGHTRCLSEITPQAALEALLEGMGEG